MRISARNQLAGTVTAIKLGTVNAEIEIAVMPEVKLVSVITRSSAEALGLQPGSPVYAIIKSSEVIIGVC